MATGFLTQLRAWCHRDQTTWRGVAWHMLGQEPALTSPQAGDGESDQARRDLAPSTHLTHPPSHSLRVSLDSRVHVVAAAVATVLAFHSTTKPEDNKASMRYSQFLRCIFVLLALVAVTSMHGVQSQEARALRVAADREATGTATHSSSTAHSTSGSLAADVASSHENPTSHKKEGPTASSFTGPLIAGALAIVLIGGVIKFRQHASANQ